jgi:hypothetical protein
LFSAQVIADASDPLTMQSRTKWIAFLFLGAGCTSTTEPLRDAHVVTSVEPGSGVTTAVIVTTTVRNDGWRTIGLETNSCPVRFRVETLSGARIELATQTCLLFSRPVSLAPGQSFSFTDRWDGTDRTGAHLSGTYRVIGQPFFDQGPQSAPVTIKLPW